MGIRFYNLNGFFVKKLAHGVIYLKNHKNSTSEDLLEYVRNIITLSGYYVRPYTTRE